MSGSSSQFTPITISLASSVSVSVKAPKVRIAVVDLKGNSPGDMKVTLDSATRIQDDSSLASKQAFTKAGDAYELDVMALKPDTGFYDLVVSAQPAKANAKLVGNTGVNVRVKVLVEQSVTNAELKITDGDQSTAGTAFNVNFPEKQASKIAVHHKQKIQLTFNVVNTASGKKMLVHQAFVKIARQGSTAEIVYVAEADSSKLYKFELDLGAEMAEFAQSGDYSLTLILGDAVVSNPLSWDIADLEINLPESDSQASQSIYQAKPEIKHTFREPESRPPQVVSSVFTLLCLAPLLVLLLLWAKLGANISNFSLSITSIGFHLGLGAIFLLYLYFWLQLNMFETVRYLVILGIVTFLCGNNLLSTIANNNK